MYVYIQSEPRLFTVGFYAPNGDWHTDSDHDIREDAALRVHYLNGGCEMVEELEKRIDYLENVVANQPRIAPPSSAGDWLANGIDPD